MMDITTENILAQARLGNPDVLRHPLCATQIKNNDESPSSIVKILWTPLHYLAHSGCQEALKHPCVALVKDTSVDQYTPLHLMAMKGIESVLWHDQVSTAISAVGVTPLHLLAELGIEEVLNHEDVGKVKNDNGVTPLHFLASSGCTDILKHSDADRVTDGKGNTPLHNLCRGISKFTKKEHREEFRKVLEHEGVGYVKNSSGETPLHLLASNGWITKEEILEKYHWYGNHGNKKGVIGILNEIVNTSAAEQYILSLGLGFDKEIQ